MDGNLLVYLQPKSINGNWLRNNRCEMEDIFFELILVALSERVKAQNELMNQEAARLTKMYEGEGHRTAILKGQANARLYPYAWCRQPGDIDIWVDGGREKVIDSTRKLGLLKGEIAKFSVDGESTLAFHHLHLPKNENGVNVEVHFRPFS